MYSRLSGSDEYERYYNSKPEHTNILLDPTVQIEPIGPIQRLPSLDGWRGFCIILVLGYHIALARDCPDDISAFTWRYFNGNLGVRMFFNISGFIITLLLIKEYERTGRISLRDFYLRRALRILPVYLGYLAFVYILQVFDRCDESLSSWLGCLSFTRNLIGQGDSPTMHFWSLSIEEQFYIIWPLGFSLLAIIRRKKIGASILIFTSLISVGVRYIEPVPPIHLVDRLISLYSMLRYADCIAVGCLTALFLNSALAAITKLWATLGAALLFMPEVYAPTITRTGLLPWMPLIQSIGFSVLLIYSLEARGWLYWILNSRIVVKIGTLSYSLYVWHYIFLDTRAPRAMPFHILNSYYFWIFPSIVVAWLSWFVLEGPSRNKRRKETARH